MPQVMLNGTRVIAVDMQLARTQWPGAAVACTQELAPGTVAAYTRQTGRGVAAVDTGFMAGTEEFMAGGGSMPVYGGPITVGATRIGGPIHTRTIPMRRQLTHRRLTVQCPRRNNLGTTATRPRAITRRCRVVPVAGIRYRLRRLLRQGVLLDHRPHNDAA